ncbi:MAG: nucleotide exchange factor GrpE [Candidatus Eisenbacteria bacterium]|uniref:Nucleotide exchange factor GrpE n=1 Tax=Eiseniibacteriota bacterium TaxID=2212470 RepID=A0A933SBN2_UNCEI|nr:nucleotide exchange factor GrpE [Candidatus Eisenbacteria bacterium]
MSADDPTVASPTPTNAPAPDAEPGAGPPEPGPEAQREKEPAPDHPTGAAMDLLVARLDDIGAQLRETNRIAEHRERSVDRLHDEVVSLRGGELIQAMMPVLRDLVRLYDDLDQVAARYAERGESAARDFGLFRDTVQDVLYRQGVEPYTAAPGDPFDARLHRAYKVVPTVDPSLDRKIARVLRIGFRSELKPVRMLEVDVHRHEPAAATGTPQTDPESAS